jgi:hypothetical protein
MEFAEFVSEKWLTEEKFQAAEKQVGNHSI